MIFFDRFFTQKTASTKKMMNIMSSDNWCKVNPSAAFNSKLCFGADEDCVMDMTMTLISENSISIDSADYDSGQTRYQQEVSLDRSNAVPVKGIYLPLKNDGSTPQKATEEMNKAESSNITTLQSKESLEEELAAKIALVEKALQDIEKCRKHYEQHAAALERVPINSNSMIETPTVLSRPGTASSEAMSMIETRRTSLSLGPSATEIKSMIFEASTSMYRESAGDDLLHIQAMDKRENMKQFKDMLCDHQESGTLATASASLVVTPTSSASLSQDMSPPDYSNETSGDRLHRQAMERNARLNKMGTKKKKIVPKTPYSEKAGSRLHQKAVERQRRLRAVAIKQDTRFPAHFLDRSKPTKLKRKVEYPF